VHPVIGYVIAVGLFAIGLFGVLTRRNAVLQLAAAELMLGGVHLVLVTTDAVKDAYSGQSFALFIVVIAAAEVGVGLALILNLWRARSSIDTDGVPVQNDGHRAAPEAPGRIATDTAPHNVPQDADTPVDNAARRP
jgi:NADH-quinone oxidoreductase subunit K